MSTQDKLKNRLADAVAKSYYKNWYKRWWGKIMLLLVLLVIAGIVYIGVNIINNIRHLNKGEVYNLDSDQWISDKQYKEGQKLFTEALTEDDPWLGAEDPLIYIIAYESFGCPYCKDSQSGNKQMLSKFGNIVRYIVKDFPTEGLHPGVFEAHLAAGCANEQGRYWDYADILYANQGDFTKADLKSYAKDIGLNEQQFNKCLDDEKYNQEIRQDYATGVQAGAVGTPSYIINGSLIPGEISYETWQEIIAFILERGY